MTGLQFVEACLIAWELRLLALLELFDRAPVMEDDPEMGSDRAAHAIEDQRAVEPNPLQSDQTTPTVEPTPEPTPSPATTSHALLCNVHVAFMICRTPERRARR